MADFSIAITGDASPLKAVIDTAKRELESLAKVDLGELNAKIGEAVKTVRNFGPALSTAGNNLKNFFSAALDALSKDAADKLRGLAEKVKTTFSNLIEPAMPAINKAFSTLSSWTEKAKKGLEALSKVDFKELPKRLEESTKKIKEIGAGLSSVGKFLTDNLTKPLTMGLSLVTKEFDARMKTLNDKIKVLFSKLFEPIIPYLVKGVDMLIAIVDKAIAWFESAPESVRMFIAIVASTLAAIGPVIAWVGAAVTGAVAGITSLVTAISGIVAGGTASVVIGAIAAAIALLVAGIGIAIGVVYALHQAWATGLGPIASYVALVVAGIITAFNPIIGIPIMIAAFLATLYEMWATNFGGIKDYTALVWNTISEYIGAAMDAIRQLVNDIGGDVVAWWNENYPLIEQTIQKVSDNVKTNIAVFLAAITAFWDAHGETIMSTVRSIWAIISTIVRTGVNVILQVVRLVMQIINGDWAGAWNTAKDIVWRIIAAIGKIVGELGNLVLQALKMVLSVITGWGSDAIGKAIDIGKNIVQGLIDGIKSLGGILWDAAAGIIRGAIDAMKRAAFINSPSRETMKVGEGLGEGLVVGTDSQAGAVNNSAAKLVKGAVKTMIDEAKKARLDFDVMAGTSADGQKAIVDAANYSDGKSNLEAIVKLRAELGKDVGRALPNTLEAVNLELEKLNKLSDGAKEAREMLERFKNVAPGGGDKPKTNAREAADFFKDKERSGAVDDAMQARVTAAAADADRRVQAEAFAQLQEKIATGYATTNAQLAEEIALLQKKKDNNFALTEVQERQFKNEQEIIRMRAEAAKNGASPEQIEAVAKKMAEEHQAVEVLRSQKKALEDQDKIYSDTMKDQEATLGKLNEQLVANTAFTEADRLKKLELSEAYKALTKEQKANIAAQSAKIEEARAKVKAQEDAKEAQENAKKDFEKFKGFITDSLKTLADKGFGAMFKSIFDKFKQMLIDMAAEWIASKLFKLFSNKDGGGTGSGGFGDIIKTIFGFFSGNKKDSSAASPAPAKPPVDPSTITGTVSDARGLFDPLPNLLAKDKAPSALAGKLSGIGAIATMAGSLIGGRVGGIISMAGMGMSIGANFGPWGAAIGAAAGAIIGLFMGDPKKKVDKKENMPKLQKGFTDAMQQLRDLLNDRNAIFSDPDGAIATAMDIRGKIASGFGIEFQSKKYKKEAQKLIAAKLVEADAMIKQIKDMADVARMANKVDSRLEAEFATGVFADRAFIRRHAAYRRRNGLLPGGWTGRDTLPSMLAPGEMVLNPRQIDRVKSNAGFDAFKGAGIPNYAGGGFIGGAAAASAPVSVSSAPVTVQIVLNNSGLVESDIKGVLVDGLKQSDVQVEIVKAYDKGKTRTR